MGQLSNPPDTLETLTPQGVTAGRACWEGTSTHTISASEPTNFAVQEDPGQLSNPGPKRVLRRLSADEIDEVVRQYVTGRTLASVALDFGVHQRTIAAHLEDRGIPRRAIHRKMSADDVAEASRRYRGGDSLAKIGVALGLDPATVRRSLHRAEVAIRPRPGW